MTIIVGFNMAPTATLPTSSHQTAAAVASIAFSDAAAAVDGNVIRVISRLRALRGDPTKNSKAIEALAAQLLHPVRPGCHNQVCGGGRVYAACRYLCSRLADSASCCVNSKLLHANHTHIKQTHNTHRP